MPRLQRTSPLALAAFTAVGLAAGLLLQFARSAWGVAPFVPPISLAATLVVIAVVLLVLGIALHRAVSRGSGERSGGARRPAQGPSGKPVNPFHAVRLLAGARAAGFAGALFGGFGGGLALQLLTRSVPPPAGTWLPMLLVLGGGVVLTVCGVIVEGLCRVPPDDPEPGAGPGAGPAPDQDAADLSA